VRHGWHGNEPASQLQQQQQPQQLEAPSCLPTATGELPAALLQWSLPFHVDYCGTTNDTLCYGQIGILSDERSSADRLRGI